MRKLPQELDILHIWKSEMILLKKLYLEAINHQSNKNKYISLPNKKNTVIVYNSVTMNLYLNVT